jgi:prepilin-type N-terminal cleavage/methylation domain-containing protein
MKRITTAYSFSHQGFTLVEILIVLTLVGVLALPFTNMFIFGVQGSHDNTEHVLAYNLAREKIEEIKGLPFEMVKSDYENFREVFQDLQEYDEAYYNETTFEKHFSDIYTNISIKEDKPKTLYNRLKPLYPKGYLKTLVIYPDDHSNFRRLVRVEKIADSAMPSKLKKVSVYIYDKDNKKVAELSTFIGLHK